MENVKAAMENAGSAGKAEAINYQSVKQKFQSYLKHPGSFAVYILTSLAALITVLVLGFIIVYILVKGVPHLTPDLFAWEYNSENVSMLPSIINTLLLTALALVIVVPIGIFSAIYMVEYAKKGNKIVSIVRVTEEALLSVPNSFREGSFGLGAGKLRTVFKVVLPSAVPGILSGIILATGRIVGETAALIYTAGTVAKVPESVFDSTRTLAVHMYNLSKEGLNTNQAYATAVVLLIVVILINMLSNFAARKLSAKQK